MVVLVVLIGCSEGPSGSALDDACERLTRATEGGPSPERRFEAEANADPEARAEVEAYQDRVADAVSRYLTELEDLAPDGQDDEWSEALEAVREVKDSSLGSMLAGADDGTTEILNENGVGDCVMQAARPG